MDNRDYKMERKPQVAKISSNEKKGSYAIAAEAVRVRICQTNEHAKKLESNAEREGNPLFLEESKRHWYHCKHSQINTKRFQAR